MRRFSLIPHLRSPAIAAVLTAVAVALAGCDGDPPETEPDPPDPEWSVVFDDLPGALLSVWGTSADDVWVVGADARDGTGPLVYHHDGAAWTRVPTGLAEGDLWWVFGFPQGPIFAGGAGGVILRHDGAGFSPMTTPGTDTVFGIWGASPDDVWAVGGTGDKNGFAWRLQGDQDTWAPEPSLPADVAQGAAVWKVFGRSASDAWLVGSNGVSYAWDGQSLVQGDTGVGSSLFTVHANADRYAAVGGLVSGFLVENDGSGWTDALPGGALYGLTGVFLDDGEGGFAVGQYGSVYERDAGGWAEVDHGLPIKGDLHGVWMDSSGGVWAVGGQTASFPLTQGTLIHLGEPIAGGDL